ncbi:MAG: head-tail joining protein [Sedimenticolaceae bacterium]|jgi:hypothetical protein
MPVESADDRAAMLADFGEAVTYTVQGGSAATITGIFDNQYVEVDAGGEVGFAVQQPRLTVRTADVPNCTEGDTFVVGGVTYLSRIVQDDGTGITLVALEKQ